MHIDGDHSYEAARSDFYTYGPLVRKGGLIVFHDIMMDYGCAKFYSEIFSDYFSISTVKKGGEQHGIGILKVGKKRVTVFE